MPLYKVSLQQGSTTRTATYEASSASNLKTFLEFVSTMKVKYIYKVEYEDITDTKPQDDFIYNRMVKAVIRNSGSFAKQTILHNVKLNRSKQEIIDKMKELLKINGSSVDSVVSYMVQPK